MFFFEIYSDLRTKKPKYPNFSMGSSTNQINKNSKKIIYALLFSSYVFQKIYIKTKKKNYCVLKFLNQEIDSNFYLI